MADNHKVPLLGEIPLDGRIPSEMGVGEPIILRAPDSALATAYEAAAGRVVAEMSKISANWASPAPGAMEV